MKLDNMPHPWPLRKDYGSNEPVQSFRQRLSFAIKRQVQHNGDLIISAIAVIISAMVMLIAFSNLGKAVEHEIEGGRKVVKESRQ